ncbi:FliM/FliN family flagellar motor switch protein [Oceaniglobus roseus]|uniref:FliM/FliN family flagellar motor switch protein n=1 Tax=Oceaniglobus roseus TaxID=1737570 RepID=UPI0012FFEBC6|nr:flagellar motor switch protein FliM [Kandeliimicrobium roseum]
MRTVLQRKAGAARPAAPKAEMTVERAWRLALTRGLSAAIGLTLRFVGHATCEVAPAEIPELVEQGDLTLLLEGPWGFGAAVLDVQLMAAITEVQTMGRVLGRAAVPRVPTPTDAALVADPLDRVLKEFEARASGLDGVATATGLRFATLAAGADAMALALRDEPHRLVECRMELDGSGREGRLRILLPPELEVPDALRSEDRRAWSEDLSQHLMKSHADLRAILARLRLPVEEVTALAPGDLLEIDPRALSQVELAGCTGAVMARGRLGQSGGMKAILLETLDPSPAPPQLRGRP